MVGFFFLLSLRSGNCSPLLVLWLNDMVYWFMQDFWDFSPNASRDIKWFWLEQEYFSHVHPCSVAWRQRHGLLVIKGFASIAGVHHILIHLITLWKCRNILPSLFISLIPSQLISSWSMLIPFRLVEAALNSMAYLTNAHNSIANGKMEVNRSA